jgi:hypothetical protein
MGWATQPVSVRRNGRSHGPLGNGMGPGLALSAFGLTCCPRRPLAGLLPPRVWQNDPDSLAAAQFSDPDVRLRGHLEDPELFVGQKVAALG